MELRELRAASEGEVVQREGDGTAMEERAVETGVGPVEPTGGWMSSWADAWMG